MLVCKMPYFITTIRNQLVVLQVEVGNNKSERQRFKVTIKVKATLSLPKDNHMSSHYPQRSFRKVMFLVVCVCPSTWSRGEGVNVTITHDALDLTAQGTHSSGSNIWWLQSGSRWNASYSNTFLFYFKCVISIGDVHTFETKLNADMLLRNHARDAYFDGLNAAHFICLLD